MEITTTKAITANGDRLIITGITTMSLDMAVEIHRLGYSIDIENGIPIHIRKEQ